MQASMAENKVDTAEKHSRTHKERGKKWARGNVKQKHLKRFPKQIQDMKQKYTAMRWYLCVREDPGCSTQIPCQRPRPSFPLPANDAWALGGSSERLMLLGFCHPCGRPILSHLTLGLTWSSPNYYGHLGSGPADQSFLLSLKKVSR